MTRILTTATSSSEHFQKIQAFPQPLCGLGSDRAIGSRPVLYTFGEQNWSHTLPANPFGGIDIISPPPPPHHKHLVDVKHGARSQGVLTIYLSTTKSSGGEDMTITTTSLQRF